jgi:PII-like signaling protein
MTLSGEGKLLRIFIGESDHWHHKPLYEEIVRLARARGLAGATVIRGIEGFGRSSHVHSARILRLSEDLPLIIEIVDVADKIDAFMQEIDPMIVGGMVTLERVEVRAYRSPGDANP